MLYLLRRKITTLLFLSCLIPFAGSAQFSMDDLNLPDHDSKPIHFGITLGINRSHYNFSHHPSFLNQDSVLAVEAVNSSGIQLAWLVNFNLSEHFDLRTYPLNLVFTEKAFEYSLKYPNALLDEKPTMTKKVQSITMSLPIQIKFSSDRINNFKVYTIAGGKIEYDFAATAGSKNAGNLIKLTKLDYGIEGGIGFHFYFPYFVLSPEIKLGWGLKNLHARDPELKYSSVIDQINSRTVTFTLTVE